MEPVSSEIAQSASVAVQQSRDADAAPPAATPAATPAGKRLHHIRKTIISIEIDLPKPKTVDDVSVIAADVLVQEKRRELGLEDDLDDDSDDKSDVDATNAGEGEDSKAETLHAQKASDVSGGCEIVDSAIRLGNGDVVGGDSNHVGAFGRSKITDIAEQLENKYKHAYKSANRKKKSLRLSILGEGYDVADPFVDDSDVVREYIPRNMQPEFGFYYVNSGPVKLVAVDVSDTEEEEEEENSDASDEPSADATDDDEDDTKKKLKDDEALADDDASSDEDEDDTEDDEITVLRDFMTKASPKKAPVETLDDGSRLFPSHPPAEGQAPGNLIPTKVCRKQLASKTLKSQSKKPSEEAAEKSRKTIIKASKKTPSKIAETKDHVRKRKKIIKAVDTDAVTLVQQPMLKGTKKRLALSPVVGGTMSGGAANGDGAKPKKKMRTTSASTDSSLPVFKQKPSIDITKLAKPKKTLGSENQSTAQAGTISSVDVAIASVCEPSEKQAVKFKKKATVSGEAATRSITITQPIIRTTAVLQQCAVTPSSSAANTRAASPTSSHSSSTVGFGHQSSSSKKRNNKDVMSPSILLKPGESPGKLVSMNGPIRNIDPVNFFNQSLPGTQRPQASGVGSSKSVKQPPSKRTGLFSSSSSTTAAVGNSNNSSVASPAENETPPPLPHIENDALRSCCHELVKLASQRIPGAGTTSFFNSSAEASRLLLDIEWRTLPIRSSERLAIYAHIAGVLGMSKTSLAQRAVRSRESQVTGLLDHSVGELKKFVPHLCSDLDRSEKGLRTVLANKGWQNKMHDCVKFSRLTYGVPLHRRDRPIISEQDHLSNLFEKTIIDEVLASHFGSRLFSANNNNLRQKTIQQLTLTYLNGNLSDRIPVPSKLADNFALVFDNGFVTAAVSPVPTTHAGGNDMLIRMSRPGSTASSSSSTNDIVVIGGTNKLTFKADAKASQQRNVSSVPLFQQPSKNVKTAGETSADERAGKQKRKLASDESPSSSSSDAGASPALGAHSVNAILSSDSSKSYKQRQPSAFFASNTVSPMRGNGSQQRGVSAAAAQQQQQQQQLLDLAAANRPAATALTKPQPFNVSDLFSQSSTASATTQYMQAQLMALMQPAANDSSSLSAAQQMALLQPWIEQWQAQQANEDALRMAAYDPQVNAVMSQILAMAGLAAPGTSSTPAVTSSIPQCDYSAIFSSLMQQQQQQQQPHQQQRNSSNAADLFSTCAGNGSAAVGGKTDRIKLSSKTNNAGKPNPNTARVPK